MGLPDRESFGNRKGGVSSWTQRKQDMQEEREKHKSCDRTPIHRNGLTSFIRKQVNRNKTKLMQSFRN